MRLLVLGGTEFLGTAIVDDAVGRGWDVTTFSRGTHPPHPAVTALVGDRTADGGLAALKQGMWDLAVDTWSWNPSAVRDATELLADRVDHYSYISTRSVYQHPSPVGADETWPVVTGSADDTDDVDYARAKRGGELAALAHFGDRALLLRAGLILGPGENIGRLPWWLGRMARGGDVLAPGPADAGIQYIDPRDLARLALSAAASRLGGALDVVIPRGTATMGDFLNACIAATESDARLHWRDPDEIVAAGIVPWTELPVWIPPGPSHDSMHESDVSRALATGLETRPLIDTVTDTWRWLEAHGGVAPQRSDRPTLGLDPDREAAFLAIR